MHLAQVLHILLFMPTQSLQTLTVHYEPLAFPPPYSYRYTLKIGWPPKGLSVDYHLEYTDREELSEEDILEEGFTPNDDFRWQGTLSPVWRQVLEEVIDRTPTLTDLLPPENEQSLVLTLQYAAQQQKGWPRNAPEWEYCLQELIQALYEASQRERPLEIRYLNIGDYSQLVHIRASFLHRRLTVETQSQKKTRQKEWKQLKPLLKAVYTLDYNPDQSSGAATVDKMPQRPGRYIDPGEGRWYLLGQEVKNPGNQDVIESLVTIIHNFL